MNRLKGTVTPVLVALIIGILIGFELGRSVGITGLTGQTSEVSEQTAAGSVQDNEQQYDEQDEEQQYDEQDEEQDPAGGGNTVSENGKYNSKEEVALYIKTYGHLPSNYVTKRDARNAGWHGGSLESFFPGCSIGGDVFKNREGRLPRASGRTYYECDIDSAGKRSRGSRRIVYSNDGLIYYSDDHYKSFTLLYGKEG